MPNIITATTLEDGPRNLIQLINITGDSSGDESGATLVDRSMHAPAGTKLVLEKVEGYLSGFTATLSFDATADLVVAQLPADDQFCYDFCEAGGVSSSKAGAGATGDLLITTDDLTTGTATFMLYMRKG